MSATYYVDYVGGSDGNLGITRSTAWKHHPWDYYATGNSLNAPLAAGDIVALRPGVLYDCHYGEITVRHSGVTTTGSANYWPGESGMAMLTSREGSRRYLALIREGTSACGNLLISSLIFTNTTGNAIRFDRLQSYNVTIEDCIIDGFEGSCGLNVLSGRDMIVRRTTIRNGVNTAARFENCTNLLVTDSVFAKCGVSGNEDGLFIGSSHAGCDTTFVVSNCVAFLNGGTGYGSGFDMSTDYGSTISSGVYLNCLSYSNNNYGFSASTANGTYINCISWANESNFALYETGDCTYLNCLSDTPVYWSFSATSAYGANTMRLTNCISVKLSSTRGYSRLGCPALDSGVTWHSDNNLTWTLDGQFINLDYNDYSLAAWTAETGNDVHGVVSDPIFSGDYAPPIRLAWTPKSTSAAINAGTVGIGGLDMANLPRPEGLWDIGPYEYHIPLPSLRTLSGLAAATGKIVLR